MKKLYILLSVFLSFVCLSFMRANIKTTATDLTDVDFYSVGVNTSLTPFTDLPPYISAFGFSYSGNDYQYLDTITYGTENYYYFEICEKVSSTGYGLLFRVYSLVPLALNFTDGKIYFVGVVNGSVVTTTVLSSSTYPTCIISTDVYNNFLDVVSNTGYPSYTKITLKTLTPNLYYYHYKSNSTMSLINPVSLTAQMLSFRWSVNDLTDKLINDNYTLGYNDGYEQGLAGTVNTNWLTSLVSGTLNILSLEIFPNIKLGYFLFIPLGFALLMFFIKVARG